MTVQVPSVQPRFGKETPLVRFGAVRRRIQELADFPVLVIAPVGARSRVQRYEVGSDWQGGRPWIGSSAPQPRWRTEDRLERTNWRRRSSEESPRAAREGGG